VKGLTLDAGALRTFDRRDRFVVSLLSRSLELGLGIAVPSGALAQAWRDGRRQARLARANAVIQSRLPTVRISSVWARVSG
jgi:hypothetical protein